ncbi:AAA family ATPase [Dactylosporangium siamense]|uniref:Adenylyl-sulfate kinase n=1 Tax=Dactylosporangium siamense TaxID=685454 RepID=A0A919UA37_9ACTN|nr:ATP-binding protein [Dactylosporangium siamense]GIG44036.1 adenylyl-sulfate kinase [Dactylosporangium siamense]
MLVEFGGLPGTGKSTLAGRLAVETGAVWVRVDEIEGAMRRNGLTPEQTGVAAYSVAHDVAANHLRRGLLVLADAVNPVAEARAGWRDLAASLGSRHLVVETVCADIDEHRRRVETRDNDLPGWVHPTWAQVQRTMASYQPRTDDRLVLDTTDPLEDSYQRLMAAVHLSVTQVRG